MKITKLKPGSLISSILLLFILFLGCTTHNIPKQTSNPILIEEEKTPTRLKEEEKPSEVEIIDADKSASDLKATIIKLYKKPSILEKPLISPPIHNNPSEDNSLGITLNNEIVEHLLDFHLNQRDGFARWLERSGRYLPLMKEILQKYGLPEDLVYIVLIESGFDTRAISSAKACGPWQLARETGLRYGLKINNWVDERHDPLKSTEAAAKYFRDLYTLFGCWDLAVASYNAGEGRVLSAIENAGSRDFWALIEDNHLPAQTREFVPKFMAATIIGKEYEEFGFKDLNFLPPLEYDNVEVKGGISLKSVAQYSGISYKEITRLNPELKKGIIPPHRNQYKLKIPYGQKEAFLRNWDKWKGRLPTEEDESTFYYRVKKGDTLWDIGKRFRISLNKLKKLNGLRNLSRLRPNQILLIPNGRAT